MAATEVIRISFRAQAVHRLHSFFARASLLFEHSPPHPSSSSPILSLLRPPNSPGYVRLDSSPTIPLARSDRGRK